MHALLFFALGAFFGGLAVHELSKLPACRVRPAPNSDRLTALTNNKRREADKGNQSMARA